jgi:hypothetical protein
LRLATGFLPRLAQTITGTRHGAGRTAVCCFDLCKQTVSPQECGSDL